MEKRALCALVVAQKSRMLYCNIFSGDESSECDKHFLPNVAWITGKNEVALTTVEVYLYWIA